MTWLSHTCFSIALLAVQLAAAPVTGRVELRDSKDPAVRKGLDYSGVVVWLEPTVAKPASVRSVLTARIEQRDKTFLPHVLAIEAGTRVNFPNFDPIFHSAFSNYNGEIFDIGLYPPGKSKSWRFHRAGVVRVFCNIHPTMSAVIVVLDTPFYAKTQKDGTFRIENVPEGDYRLRLFHERTTEERLKSLARAIHVGNDPVAVPVIPISESGYVAVPHTNKYGHDYRTPPDQGGLYPAGKP